MRVNKNKIVQNTNVMISIKFQSILFREFRNNQYYKLTFVIGDPLKIYYLFVNSLVVCVCVCVFFHYSVFFTF